MVGWEAKWFLQKLDRNTNEILDFGADASGHNRGYVVAGLHKKDKKCNLKSAWFVDDLLQHGFMEANDELVWVWWAETLTPNCQTMTT